MAKKINLIKIWSFSLVELMVVIAIIGILSAVAVPSYKTYIIKSKIASGLPTVSFALNKAIQDYETLGTFSNPLSIYNSSISKQGSLVLNSSPVEHIYYDYDTSKSSVLACMYFIDIGVPGYVAGAGNSGTKNRICMAANLNATTQIWVKSCGIWGMGETMDIPTQYLPSGCNCGVVNATWFSGATC